MKIAGVICEFNPFHKGHEYALKKARELTGCDAVLCVMSGNFVQRAEPAILGMRLRAEAALALGADAVIELPALYAAACAERFSEGAVNILNSIPSITHLVFGSEHPDIIKLQKIAECQIDESDGFKRILKESLKKGLPYPAAISDASAFITGTDAAKEPNDILAVEYLKQLIKTGSRITPVSFQRQGDYHDNNLNAGFSSASAIRQAVYNSDISNLADAMGEYSYKLLYRDRRDYTDVKERFGLLAVSALRERDLSSCPDDGEGLGIKLKKAAHKFTDLDAVIKDTKSKRYTNARIRRLIFEALLCITHYPDLNGFDVPCKLIGIKKDFKESFLASINGNIIVKNSDFKEYVSSLNGQNANDAGYIYSINLRASNLYNLIRSTDGNTYEKLRLLEI